MASQLKLRQTALLGVAGVALAAFVQSPALAQQNIEEVVVTGTMIRGIEPVGSNVIALSPDQIQAIGANNTAQLVASMPQATAFNNYVATLPGFNVAAGQNRVPIARPNLRGLPYCDGAASGTCTLILVDGHRVVPEGLQQLAVDPQIIPTGLVERVETILDGNSAIYGSDAVGGVMNFITRKNFEGVLASAHYGIMSGSNSVDADLTAGHAWDKGSIVLTYSFGKHDPLFGFSRDWAKSINYTTDGLPTGRTCDNPNVTANGVNYPVVNGVVQGTPGVVNACDLSKFGSLYSKQLRNGGGLTITQEITDTIKFDMTAMYSASYSIFYNGPFTGTATITTRNPYYQPIPGVAGTPSESVSLSYGPLFGNEVSTNGNHYEAGQITPTLTVDVGSWQIRNMFNWGKSKTSYANPSLNTTAQNLFVGGPTGSTAAIPISAALNPYNLLGTTNTALFSGLLYTDRSDGISELTNARSIADGKVFSLPGGDVHAAVGIEWQQEKFKTRITNAVTRILQDYVGVTQHDIAGFGELNIPIVGKSNSRPGIESLVFDVSGRYDKYTGISGKFVPKVGGTYQPVDWITVRSNWGKSFNAPNAADVQGELPANTNILLLPITNNATGGFNQIDPKYLPIPGAPFGSAFLFSSGDQQNITPQTSSNFSIGGDVTPPILPDLTVSATYYTIHFNNIISLPTPTGDQSYLYKYYAATREIINPCPAVGVTTPSGQMLCPLTAAQLAAYSAESPTSAAAAIAQAAGAGQAIVLALDDRVGNIGSAKLSGIDFNVRYAHKTSFGSIDANFSGNYHLSRTLQPGGIGNIDDLYQSQYPHMNFQLTAGANVGDHFRGQATWNHTSGMELVPSPSLVATQTTLGAFNTVDLFFRYDFEGASAYTKDLTVTLNVNNVTDAAPPVYLFNGAYSPQNGPKSLGRLVQFGVSKKF